MAWPKHTLLLNMNLCFEQRSAIFWTDTERQPEVMRALEFATRKEIEDPTKGDQVRPSLYVRMSLRGPFFGGSGLPLPRSAG